MGIVAASADLELTGSGNKSGGNLKTMLEEVLRSGAGGASCNSTVEGMSSSVAKNSLTTYIRDAARFTELTSSHSEENCTTTSVSAVAAAAATIPIPTSEKTKLRENTTQILKKNKEEDDLDLD
jgi:hypothetical protein